MGKQVSKIRSPLKAIFLSGIVAGSLDMLAAIAVYSVLLQKVQAATIIQSIASGIVGSQAYSGGGSMILYGLLIHFFIALSFAAAYFFIYPHIPFFKTHSIAAGILYGVFVWLMMNLVVLPLTFHHTIKITTDSITGIIILIMAVGIPVSMIINNYYTAIQKTSGAKKLHTE